MANLDLSPTSTVILLFAKPSLKTVSSLIFNTYQHISPSLLMVLSFNFIKWNPRIGCEIVLSFPTVPCSFTVPQEVCRRVYSGGRSGAAT